MGARTGLLINKMEKRNYIYTKIKIAHSVDNSLRFKHEGQITLCNYC